MPSRRTTRRIWLRDAPSAVRTPNSRLRRLTAYDNTLNSPPAVAIVAITAKVAATAADTRGRASSFA
ncbi:MAG: hypothetical protein JF632_02115 [Acidobacteria bacterium]|nr:hypothetical protein [Acidobacteriota bacterium]